MVFHSEGSSWDFPHREGAWSDFSRGRLLWRMVRGQREGTQRRRETSQQVAVWLEKLLHGPDDNLLGDIGQRLSQPDILMVG
jgi:hypothetical protein